jgi:hypothetical protein
MEASVPILLLTYSSAVAAAAGSRAEALFFRLHVNNAGMPMPNLGSELTRSKASTPAKVFGQVVFTIFALSSGDAV